MEDVRGKREEVRGKREEGRGTREDVEGAVLLAKDVKHVLTHRILYADFYFMEVTEKPSLPEGYIWVKESALDDYAKPRLIEKLLEKLFSSSSPR